MCCVALASTIVIAEPYSQRKGQAGIYLFMCCNWIKEKEGTKTGNVSQLIRRASSGFGVETAVFPNMNKHVDVKMQMLHKIVEKKTEERESSELTVILSKVSMHIHGF